MKKEPKRKAPSKKKTRAEQKEKPLKKDDSKWKDFLHRHSKTEEKKVRKSNGSTIKKND